MIGNGRFGISSIDASLISSIQEELFVLGKSFSYEDYLTFSASETKTIAMDSSLYLGENLTLNPLIFGSTAGPVRVDFYTGCTFNSDGTLLEASNRREGQPLPKSILRLNPTGLVLGTRFAGDLIPATGVGVGNVTPGSNSPGLPFEIDKNLNHAIQITNDDGEDTIIQIKMTWFEV